MKGRSRSFFLVLAAIPFIACSSGCDRYAKHKVLTFFFTGVPPLDEGGKGPEKEMEAAKKAEQGPRQRKRRPFVEATRFSHGPYASGACYLCHETSETGGFRGFSKEAKAAGSIAKPGIVPGELVAPLRELCVGCHETKSPESARRNGLWVHGPVSGIGAKERPLGPRPGKRRSLHPVPRPAQLPGTVSPREKGRCVVSWLPCRWLRLQRVTA